MRTVFVGVAMLLAALAISEMADGKRVGEVSAQKKMKSCFDVCMTMVGSGPKLNTCQSRCQAKREMKRAGQRK